MALSPTAVTRNPKTEIAAGHVRQYPARHIPLRSPYTTVHNPIKKEGAGGSYTWGGIVDVKDFELVGTQRAATVSTLPSAAITTVGSTIPATSTTTTVSTPTATTPLNINSFAQFPHFGVGCTPAPVMWGPMMRTPLAASAHPQSVMPSAEPTSPISGVVSPSSSASPMAWVAVQRSRQRSRSAMIDISANTSKADTKEEQEESEDRASEKEERVKGNGKQRKVGNCSIQ